MPYTIRPPIPPDPNELRNIVYFGGPLDGRIVRGIQPSHGYIDTGGALAIWHALNVALLWFTE